MSSNLLGKLLMSLAIGVFTFIPPIVDLGTATHVFHEGWLPHARMHTVWLISITSSVGLLALYLLWGRKTDTRFTVNLAAIISLCVYGSFFLSAITMPLYGGALNDGSGVPPGPFGIDSNVFGFGSATVFLLLGWLLFSRPSDAKEM